MTIISRPSISDIPVMFIVIFVLTVLISIFQGQSPQNYEY